VAALRSAWVRLSLANRADAHDDLGDLARSLPHGDLLRVKREFRAFGANRSESRL
jgi:hypothetical protein